MKRCEPLLVALLAVQFEIAVLWVVLVGAFAAPLPTLKPFLSLFRGAGLGTLAEVEVVLTRTAVEGGLRSWRR